MAGFEEDSLTDLLEEFIYHEDLRIIVSKLVELRYTVVTLISMSDSGIDDLILKHFPDVLSEGATTGFKTAIRRRKEHAHEGEPLLKKAKRLAEEHLSSDALYDAENSYYGKLLEPPSELLLSANELMKFLSLTPVPLPTRHDAISTSVRDRKLVVLDTSTTVAAFASFCDCAFRLMEKVPVNEPTSSHLLCYITADFLTCLNDAAPINRRLQSLNYLLDAPNPTSTNKASRPLKPLLRPDLQLYVKDCLIFRWENKIDPTLLEAAVHENISKLEAWSPLFYGRLPYVIGGSCAGSTFRWLKIYPTNKEIACEYISVTYDLHKPKSLAGFLHSVIRIHCLLQKLQEKLDGEIRVKLYLPKKRDNGKVVVTVYPGCVVKEIKGLAEAKVTLLRSLYNSIAGSTYLIQGTVSESADDKTTLQLQPVGDPFAKPRSLEDLENAMHDMLHGLAELHSKGYTHRDIRWDNCIKVMVAGESKWVIIDLEEAGPHDELWVGDYLTFWDAQTLEGDNDQKKRYTKGSDIYQLGKLIAACLDGISVGDEENRRLIRSRAEKMQQERTAAAKVLEDVCKKGCKRCGKFDAKL